MVKKEKRWYIKTVIAKLRDADTFLRYHCSNAASELGADLALSIAACTLASRVGALGSVEPFLSSLPGLRDLLSAYEVVQSRHGELLETLDSAFPALTPDALGLLYERCRSHTLVAKEGSIYTPAWLASEIVTKAMAGRRGKVLDPACGGGIFLLAAYRTASDRELARLGRIFGVDRDPKALLVARVALLLEALETIPRSKLEEADQIVAENIALGDSLLDRRLLDARAPFDVVIGNPPYGLSRDERISPEEKSELASLYAASRTGKMNKYLLFMARGFELLAPGGRLGFVVPNSWLGISSAEAVRRQLLSEGSLLEINAFTEPVFDDPSVEVVTFLAEHGARSQRISISHRDSTGVTLSGFDIPSSRCREHRSCAIPLVWSDALDRFFERIDHNSIALGSEESPMLPLIAMQAYARGKGKPPQSEAAVRDHVFDRASADEPDVLPYLQGSDIQRYGYRHSGSFLKYGPWLAEPQDLSRFTGPRIVVREILGTGRALLIATFIEEVALYNKSVLNLLPKADCTRSMVLAILGVLNSAVASLVIGCRGNKSQRRLFPKVVNADLKAFPLPRALLTDPDTLAALVAARLTSVGDSSSIEREIEREVLRLYGVDSIPEIPAVLVPHLNKTDQAKAAAA